jgi:hypothetical protein
MLAPSKLTGTFLMLRRAKSLSRDEHFPACIAIEDVGLLTLLMWWSGWLGHVACSPGLAILSLDFYG